MADITITAYSDELTKLVVNNQFINPNAIGGKVKVATFTFTNGTVALAADSTIMLTRLPKGSKILDLKVESNNATATSTLAVGYTGTASLVDTNDEALVAHTANADGSTSLSLADLASLTDISEESYIFATVGTAAFGASKYIKGYVLYIDGSY